MTIQTSSTKRKFDLEERTLKFGIEIIKFAKIINQDPITRPLISQIVRAGTSIGANYSEANECNSKKDFFHKIGLAKKEAKETIYWLNISRSLISDQKKIDLLKQEAHEFVLIFSAILKKNLKIDKI